jgi:Fe-S cluster biogenesis protein NfuA/nitrite reductase/ring-hydroxylating ferredoxin subunit
MAEYTDADQLVERVQALSERVDALDDDRARALAQELVGAVMEMYGDGLARIVRVLDGAGDAGMAIRDELAEDGSVASLLLIHDLYPVDLQTRVGEALDTVRPYMESHGGNVELLSLDDGVARLRLQGSCSGCAASQATLELAIKQALDEHAPDLAGLEVEGVAEPPTGGVELPMVHVGGPELPVVNGNGGGNGGGSSWVALDGAKGLEAGRLRPLDAEGVALVVANVDGSLLAYRNACAGCGAALDNGELDGRMLRCRECGVEFDLPRAGRAAGNEPLQLAPIPLLDDGGIRVAV